MRKVIISVLIISLCSAGAGRRARREAEANASTQSSASTQATTAPLKLPTPAELAAKMRGMRAQRDALAKIAYIDITGPIVEKPADFSLFGDDDTLTLRSIIDRIQKAAADKDIRGILINLSESEVNFAQAQEIRDALAAATKVGRPTFVYADSYDSPAYTLATGASHICMLEGGEIMIPGVGMETMFAKGLLDKVGLKADYIQIGEYKGADEQYTRTEPSTELRGELNRLIDSMYDELVDGIATRRHLAKEKVQAVIDDAMISGKDAKERGLVDHLLDQDGLRKLIADEIGEKIDLVHNYGQTARESIDFSNPFALFALMSKRPDVTSKPTIALIHVDGVIIDGDGGQSLFGGSSIGSSEMRRALRTALRDDNVKAVVLRIDSPGGSALASEVMWQAARRVAEKKPVIISIGSMAASGGYYLASAGDHIFADPCGIVGSIGVVGGKFVMKDLFDKLGITTWQFSKGANAGLFSSNEPFDARQRTMLTKWMKETYDQFTQRVMSTRGEKIKDIDKVARGRIFAARQAKELGLVDELGGVHDAIAYAAKKTKLSAGAYDVRVMPAPRTLADYFNGGFVPETKAALPRMIVAPDSLLRALSPGLRKLLSQQLCEMQLLQQHPVLLVAPLSIQMK